MRKSESSLMHAALSAGIISPFSQAAGFWICRADTCPNAEDSSAALSRTRFLTLTIRSSSNLSSGPKTMIDPTTRLAFAGGKLPASRLIERRAGRALCPHLPRGRYCCDAKWRLPLRECDDVGATLVGAKLSESPTSPRLRGEVGICALSAQIPGEGASPRV